MTGSFHVRLATIADATGIARVHIDTWLTTYRGIVPDTFLEKFLRPDAYEKRAAKWVDIFEGKVAESTGATFVALDARGGIIGFSSGGPEREKDPDYHGELYAIYLLASHQGKGIGRQLACEVARYLSGSGFHNMLVWVLEKNPACRFYEALGGLPVRQKKVDFGGSLLNEVGYGWKDLSSLLTPVSPPAPHRTP